MEFSDTRIIKADRETVWAHLNNPETLAACISGCEELTGSPEEGFEAVVKQKVGPVKATFKGNVTISDVDAPNGYQIAGEGKGGVAGFAKGGAIVTLRDVAEGCELSYEVDAKVGGKIAQLGSRLINGFVKKMTNHFFEKFQEIAEGPAD